MSGSHKAKLTDSIPCADGERTDYQESLILCVNSVSCTKKEPVYIRHNTSYHK